MACLPRPKTPCNASHFDTWKTRSFDDFQALLSDDVSFKGSLGAAEDATSCCAGIEVMSKITADIVAHAMAVDGGERRHGLYWFSPSSTY